MITNRTYGKYTWVDLHLPTKQEINSLVETKQVDVKFAKDLIAPTPKQLLRHSDDSIYAVIHIPSFRDKYGMSSDQEIDFVISKKELVTARYDSIDSLHFFGKQIETDEILNKEKEEKGHIFFAMVKEIYKFLFDEIDYLHDSTKRIEQNVFNGKEKEMVFGISLASRNVLNFKRIAYPHKLVWTNLKEAGGEIFGADFAHEAEALLEEWERLNLEIEHVSNMVDELRDTNNSILSSKQNETMKIFTILAFLTFPLSVIASVFGMNAVSTPLIGIANDFWIILGLMFAVSLAMFFYFKYKRWI